jgi:hypothetical protein
MYKVSQQIYTTKGKKWTVVVVGHPHNDLVSPNIALSDTQGTQRLKSTQSYALPLHISIISGCLFFCIANPFHLKNVCGVLWW